MKSALPKVLHPLAGQPLITHVLSAVQTAGGATATAVVIGPDHAAVGKEAARVIPSAETFVQTDAGGTAHAVLAARAAIERGVDDVLVIFGDTPLIRPETLREAARRHWPRARPSRCSAFAPPTRPATAGW